MRGALDENTPPPEPEPDESWPLLPIPRMQELQDIPAVAPAITPTAARSSMSPESQAHPDTIRTEPFSDSSTAPPTAGVPAAGAPATTPGEQTGAGGPGGAAAVQTRTFPGGCGARCPVPQPTQPACRAAQLRRRYRCGPAPPPTPPPSSSSSSYYYTSNPLRSFDCCQSEESMAHHAFGFARRRAAVDRSTEGRVHEA